MIIKVLIKIKGDFKSVGFKWKLWLFLTSLTFPVASSLLLTTALSAVSTGSLSIFSFFLIFLSQPEKQKKHDKKNNIYGDYLFHFSKHIDYNYNFGRGKCCLQNFFVFNN